MTKPFTTTPTAEQDEAAKQRVARYLFAQGFEVTASERPGIDLDVSHEGRRLCGVEVVQQDFGGRCTVECIRVAHNRRARFEAAPQNVLFSLDRGGKWAYYVTGLDVTRSPLVKIGGSSFFNVPRENWREIVLE